MLAVLYIHDMILVYTLVIMGLLCVTLLAYTLSRNARDWKISRITLRQCQKCHLVFAESRFSKNHKMTCPRCNSETKIIQADS